MINKDIKFDEMAYCEEHKTVTLYFTAPKELMNTVLPYTDDTSAVSMEISLEYPKDNRKDLYIQASPTNAEGEDYDWYDVDFSDADIEKLFKLYEEQVWFSLYHRFNDDNLNHSWNCFCNNEYNKASSEQIHQVNMRFIEEIHSNGVSYKDIPYSDDYI